MANVGWVGLGNLGAPCAAALARYGGHAVYGYDLRGAEGTYAWSGLDPVHLTESVAEVVKETDEVVFLAVQTPHDPRYGGETVAPEEPRDFEYGYLVDAVRRVCVEAEAQAKRVTLAIVSTVLPGTFNRYLRPLLNAYVTPVYHPFFIAMGTVIEDFVRPEMLLFGADEEQHSYAVQDLYNSIHSAPSAHVSIESAELAKVAYNTFITAKIVFSNSLAEICDHTGADVDEVVMALELSTDRVISAKYLRAGMGDGGACHPRDNIALSALAQQFNTSVDLSGFLVRSREAQTARLARLVERWARLSNLSVMVLGRTYKPNVALTAGSPALLLRELLDDLGVASESFDPLLDPTSPDLWFLRAHAEARVFVVATAHPEFADYQFPAGSVVVDPFGYLRSRPGVTLVRPGRKGAV